jgi:hypothetical protein
MANLLFKPKCWFAVQSAYDTVPTFAASDSITATASLSAEVETETVTNPADLVKFINVVATEKIRAKASLKIPLYEAIWDTKVKDSLRISGFGGTTTQLNMGGQTQDTYGAFLFNVDGFKFLIKNARGKPKFSMPKNGILTLDLDIEGELVLTGLPTEPSFTPVTVSDNMITSVSFSGKTNYWATLEIDVRPTYYNQKDQTTGAPKLILTNIEASLKVDYDAGVLASWDTFLTPGNALTQTILINGSTSRKISVNGILTAPAMLKDRDGIASQDLEFALKTLTFYFAS